MNKDNVFKSSQFYMDNGDVLHVILKNFTGDGLTITLNSGSTDEIEDASIIESEDVIYSLIDKDGNLYTVVTIGNQQWTVENLRTTTYADGTLIPNIVNDALWLADTAGAYCWYNDDSATYKATYGALYNWYAVDHASGLAYFERGGVQQTGWRIPTKTDFDALIAYLGGSAVAGGKLKEAGLTYWTTPNTGAVDTYGFKLLPAGYRTDTVFEGLLEYTYLWSATAPVGVLAYSYDAGYNYAGMPYAGNDKYLGFSVRCVRDTGVIQPLRDYDGNEYTTVIIGTQEWIVENLKTTHYADGTAIANLTVHAAWINDITGAYCWYDNDEVTYKDDYGALYNWYAVSNESGLVYFKRGEVQETGWRIPTKGDLQVLSTYLGGNSISGGKLKETGTTYWTTPNTGATNDYGFKARGSGHRDATGAYDLITELFYAWTSTESGAYTYRFRASYNSAEATVTEMDGVDKILGYAVRCVRDV